MAWSGRKPLTVEQRAQRLTSKGGLLNEEDQNKILDLVRGGHLATDALRSIGRANDTLYNTLSLDPEFQREFDNAKIGVAEMIEEALIGKALGQTNIMTTIRYKRAVDEHGKWARNPDGSPKWEETTMTKVIIPADTGAAVVWLKAYRPDKFDKSTRLELSTTIQQGVPEETETLLADRWQMLSKRGDRLNETNARKTVEALN